VTERAWKLIGSLRLAITMLPNATSVAIFESRTWTLISVGAATEDSVFALALLLGLSKPKERRVETPEGYRRWLFASAERTERGRGLIQINVTGPRLQDGEVG
jgi:hypothetical protein